MAINGTQVQIATVDQPLSVQSGWTLLSLAMASENEVARPPLEGEELVEVETVRTIVPLNQAGKQDHQVFLTPALPTDS